MIHFSLAKAAALLDINTALSGEFTGVSIDTRTLVPGNLFIAIQGERVDGLNFIAQAEQAGAAAILTDRPCESGLPILLVPDVTLALGKLAHAWRDAFELPIIAVTGSNGKTTTKNMVASILTAACDNHADDVLATLGTLNNHLGLPLTLARLGKHHRYAVIEMGMNHFGEIDYLSRLTQPTVTVITNAGASHLEGVGNLAGVAKAKGEIFNGLTQAGVAILNKDDTFFDYWQGLSRPHQTLTFGMKSKADVSAESVELRDNKQALTINTPKGQFTALLPLVGEHNVLNALAATAAALAVNIPLTAIQAGLEQCSAASGRLQVHQLKNGVTLIDDTYNANPLSVKAAIDTLSHYKGKKIIVLGDMKELGENAERLHETAGNQMREAGIDYLFTFGTLSANTARAFGHTAKHFSDQAPLISELKPHLENATILVKGSRSMHMEKVIAGIAS